MKRGFVLCAWALALAALPARAGDEETVRCFQIEVLYTVHTSVDTDEKLERIRALVLKAYPEAKFEAVSVEDRRAYCATYRDRIFQMAGVRVPADPFPEDSALRDKLFEQWYQAVKPQVDREVALRSIYRFLHSQARDDVSLKVIFEKLKEKDDPKNPVCGTEPGKTAIVYRDFGGKPLTADKLPDIEDGGVKFGFGFIPRVALVALDDSLPEMSPKADLFGDDGEGRQIFRLVAVTKEPAPAPQAPPDHK